MLAREGLSLKGFREHKISMKQAKLRLQRFLLASITVNEIFLACSLAIASIFYEWFRNFYIPNLNFHDIEGFIMGLVGVTLVVWLFFVTPLYYSGKLVFKSDQSVLISKFELFMMSIWGTIWLVFMIPINFVTLISKLGSFDIVGDHLFTLNIQSSFFDYFSIVYLSFFLIRLFLLFFFSAYLHIERLSAVHIPTNRTLFAFVICYSFYVLFQQAYYGSGTNGFALDFAFSIFQPAVIAFMAGSFILQIYYLFINKESYIQIQDVPKP
ncbi:MAG: hypothetical protein JWP09_161 [Candidatus Taylorbacteria bacterium]|nr:hypothetical protein [Candidatus Taylorbacteria bacterium]